jgi:hypothetical protein
MVKEVGSALAAKLGCSETPIESQRDSIHQPKVARYALPWVNTPNISSTLKGLVLAHGHHSLQR